MTRISPNIAVVALLGLAGCIRGSIPALELYRLVPAPTAEVSDDGSIEPGAPVEGSVAVSKYVTPGLYGEPGIVYRVGETEYGAYRYREWAIPLGEMLGLLTSNVLERSRVTAQPPAYDPPSRRNFTYQWRGTVRQFEEVNRGQQVLVTVHLGAQLIRTADDSILWTGSQRMERAVPEGSMSAIVAALSAIADDVIRALVSEAKVSLRQTRRHDTPAARVSTP